MKKFVSMLSMILTLCLLLGTTVLAEIRTLNDENKTGTTTIEYVVAADYTVTIPPSVTIDSEEGKGTGTVTVSAGATLSLPNKYLRIQINKGANSENSIKRLKEVNSLNYIPYIVTKSSGTEVTNYLLQVTCPNQEAVSETLTFTLDGEVPGAGTYTDALTFTVSLSQNPITIAP